MEHQEHSLQDSTPLILDEGGKAKLLALSMYPVNVARGMLNCQHCGASVGMGDVHIRDQQGASVFCMSLMLIHRVVYHPDMVSLPDDLVTAIQQCPLPKPPQGPGRSSASTR